MAALPLNAPTTYFTVDTMYCTASVALMVVLENDGGVTMGGCPV